MIHDDDSAAMGPTIDPAGWPPAQRWPQALHRGIEELTQLLESWISDDEHLTRPPHRILIAVSGGADSLALAVVCAVAAQLKKFTRSPWAGLSFSTLTVDHQLQSVTQQVAKNTVTTLQTLGFTDTQIATVRVDDTDPEGLEAAARTARYQAITDTLHQMRTTHNELLPGVLVAHTADDQAEQVLLGIARGSGTKTLSGIPAHRELTPGVQLGRPLLGLTRQDAETICRWAGITWWDDPMNQESSIARIRVRNHLLPALADPVSGLGPGIRTGLVTTAAIAAEDAHALDLWADEIFATEATFTDDEAPTIHLPAAKLLELPAAIRHRVISRAITRLDAPTPSRERVLAVAELITGNLSGTSAGPIELEGHVQAFRKHSANDSQYATLILRASTTHPINPTTLTTVQEAHHEG